MKYFKIYCSKIIWYWKFLCLSCPTLTDYTSAKNHRSNMIFLLKLILSAWKTIYWIFFRVHLCYYSSWNVRTCFWPWAELAKKNFRLRTPCQSWLFSRWQTCSYISRTIVVQVHPRKNSMYSLSSWKYKF